MLLALALALAACGSTPKPAPIQSRGGEPSPAMTDPVVVLRALAQAANTDDGAALDALVHPAHGMWLWDHPGAAVHPTVHVTTGTGEPPSRRFASSLMSSQWKEHYWPSVAIGLEALDRMDREPADRFAPIYGDCGAEDASGANLRAWLVERDDFESLYGPLLVDTPADAAIAPALRQPMTHYRSWGLDVWLAHDQSRLWVAHVMVWTPCSA